MIEHVVLFRWKPGTPAAALEELGRAFRALPGKIPAIKDYAFGPNFSERSGGHTHILVSRFASHADLDAYLDHPEHQRVLERHIRPILESLLVADLDRP